MADKHPDHTETKWLSPVLMGLTVFVLIAVLARGLSQREETNMRTLVRAEAGKLITYIQTDLTYRVPMFERMSARWVVKKGLTKEEFTADAQNFIRDLPGVRAIQWVNQNYTVEWVVPLEGNESEKDARLAFSNHRRPAMEQAKAKNIATMTTVFTLDNNKKVFIIYAPIQIWQEFSGLIGAIIEVNPWLETLIAVHESQFAESNFKATISIERQTIFEQNGTREATDKKYRIEADKRILGKMFTVSVEPTASFVKETSTALPQLTLIFGAIFSLLTSLTIFLMQRTAQQKRHLLTVTESLEDEIEQRNIIEAKLYETSSSLSLAINAGQIGVWSWNIKTDELYWNDYMYKFYGIDPDTKLTFDVWKSSLYADDAATTLQMLKGALKGINTFDTEYRILTPTGVIRYIQAAATLEKDASGNPIRMLGVNTDITERKKAEETIKHMANYDLLTDLPTRRLAIDRMKVAITAAQRNNTSIAVLFMDLDGFKPINDKFGHKAGDAALKEVARRLQGCIRKSDTVARIGGDEFLVILTEIKSTEGISQVAKKMIEVISQPFSYQDKIFNMGISIGIAVYPNNGTDIDQLISLADKAMYVSKNSGKNSFAYVPGANS